MAKKAKTALRKAVDYLIEHERIKNDVDLALKLDKMSKGTLSTYLNGIAIPSANFIEKFQNKFGIKVADFEENTKQEPIYSNEALLIKLNKEYEDRIAELKQRMVNVDQLMINLAQMSENQALIEARIELAVDLLIEVHPTLKKIKDPEQAAHALDMRLAPKIEKALKRGNRSGATGTASRS